jgi:hypothetical protein
MEDLEGVIDRTHQPAAREGLVNLRTQLKATAPAE